MQNVTGIDISKGKLDICAIFDDGMKTKTVKIQSPDSNSCILRSPKTA